MTDGYTVLLSRDFEAARRPAARERDGADLIARQRTASASVWEGGGMKGKDTQQRDRYDDAIRGETILEIRSRVPRDHKHNFLLQMFWIITVNWRSPYEDIFIPARCTRDLGASDEGVGNFLECESLSDLQAK